MKQPEDALGQPLVVGNFISYVTRRSSNMTLHLAQIVEITWDGSIKHSPWSIKVIAAGKRFQWDRINREWNRDPYAYKRTLRSNATIVTVDKLPKAQQDVIDTYLNNVYFAPVNE